VQLQRLSVFEVLPPPDILKGTIFVPQTRDELAAYDAAIAASRQSNKKGKRLPTGEPGVGVRRKAVRNRAKR